MAWVSICISVLAMALTAYTVTVTRRSTRRLREATAALSGSNRRSVALGDAGAECGAQKAERVLAEEYKLTGDDFTINGQSFPWFVDIEGAATRVPRSVPPPALGARDGAQARAWLLG